MTQDHPTLVDRLNHASGYPMYDAHTDIGWDNSSQMAIESADPRWELSADDPLGADPWYLDQPAHQRRRIGIHRTAETMSVNIELTKVFRGGLLLHAAALPAGSPEFRYIHHEIAEQARHSAMSQEFINRSGAILSASPPEAEDAYDALMAAGRDLPELFFLNALIREDINDHFQRRRMLRSIPSVLHRIFRVHVREAARHRSYARGRLQQRVPLLIGRDRARLTAHASSSAIGLAHQLLLPSASSCRTLGIPESVVARAASSNHFRHLRATSLAGTETFLRTITLITDEFTPLWAPLRAPRATTG